MPKVNHFSMVARNAVRSALVGVGADTPVGVGVSGGADSLALLLGLSMVYRGERAGLVHVVSVDHQLQEVTASVSAGVAALASSFGFTTHIVPVDIKATAEGAEADARRARYEAFESVIVSENLGAFLLGHTQNDQAEQVMLGLLRGSGTRSLAGIPYRRGVFVRPFLNVLGREGTQQVCVENNVEFWCDPHNELSVYNRVNVRKFIKGIEQATGQPVVGGLVRSAQVASEDADALDFYAGQVYEETVRQGWGVKWLSTVPPAVRKRVFKLHLVSLGVPPVKTGFDVLNSVDGLVSAWNGQVVANIYGSVRVSRKNGVLIFSV